MGPNFSDGSERVERSRPEFDTLASNLHALLDERIQPKEEALEVWGAVPSVMGECDDPDMFDESRSRVGLLVAPPPRSLRANVAHVAGAREALAFCRWARKGYACSTWGPGQDLRRSPRTTSTPQ